MGNFKRVIKKMQEGAYNFVSFLSFWKKLTFYQ